MPVAHDLGGRGRHLLQGFDGFLGLALLVDAQHRIDEHNGKNDDDVGKTLVLHGGQHAADGGSDQQNEDHGIGQLFEKTAEDRLSFGFGQTVGAVLCQALFRFGRGETGLRGAERRKDFLAFCQVVSHFLSDSFSRALCRALKK